MSSSTSAIGRGRLRVALAGAAGLGGLATASALVAGVDALVKVRPPGPAPAATLVDWAPDTGSGATITLRGPSADTPGTAGLLGPTGRLLVSHPTQVEDGWRRRAVALPGADAPLLDVGAPFEVTRDPWVGCVDPFALGAEDRRIATPLGDLRMTTVAAVNGSSRRALVYLHGKGGNRNTGWWLAPTARAAGWRVVLPAYRNDPDDGFATGRYLLGGEWVDLVAVLDHLADEHVDEVVLAGWSMGGNIAASYLRQRQREPEAFAHHPRITGLVLDAAALDWGAVLRHVARSRRLPHHIVPAIMTYGQLVGRIDWRGLDHVQTPAHLDLPILAMHGTADTVVPVELTHALASALPRVELLTFEGAGHCASVNLDPWRYLGALRSFLERLATPAPVSDPPRPRPRDR